MSTPPTEPGLYLARTPNANWFHIVVVIEGKAPYLSFRAWDRMPECRKPFLSGSYPTDLIFGPRIEAANEEAKKNETTD